MFSNIFSFVSTNSFETSELVNEAQSVPRRARTRICFLGGRSGEERGLQS